MSQAYIKIYELPGGSGAVDINGTPAELVRLIMSTMKAYPEFSVSVISAAVLHANRNDIDLNDVLKASKLAGL